MRPALLVIGFFILIVSEILRVYFIMPLPGSQQMDTIDFASFFHFNIGHFRLTGLMLAGFPPCIFLRWRQGR